MEHSKKFIIALDGMDSGSALKISKKLKGKVWGFKVNDLLFSDSKIITKLKKYGKMFADAKLHDIPNTVFNSTKKLSNLGADIITVHGKGGVEMMRAAVKAKGKAKVFAVTILTSDAPNPKLQKKLIEDSLKAKVDGIICSGLDLPAISKIKGSSKLLKATPGIRVNKSKSQDQRRVCTPEEAIDKGADLLVIGRDWEKIIVID